MHEMITYCSQSMAGAYNLFAPRWAKHFARVTVYTDGELPLVTGVKVVRLMPRTSDKWQDGIKGKVLSVLNHFRNGGAYACDHVTFMDADCEIRRKIGLVYGRSTADVIVTRMVNRHDESGDASSGVLFLRNAYGGRQFVRDWAAASLRPEAWEGQRDRKPAPDQTALHQICIDAFDGLKPYTCAIASERIYNGGCEAGSGDISTFYDSIRKYNPAVIHYKCGWWDNDGIRAKVKEITGDA
jgi:hypothetical protein